MLGMTGLLYHGDSMKKLIVLLIVLFASYGYASDLYCDPQAGVVAYDVSVDGIVVSTDYPAEADGSVLFNIDAYGDHQNHVFLLMAIDASGWRGPASDPFDAREPVKSGGVGIK